LVLSPKPRNYRGDFEAQITKPELPVLRPKPGNLPPPWFWGSTKKLAIGFEAKLGETVTTSFEAKQEKTIVAGFKAKPLETVTTDFEAKLAKTVRVVLRPNHSQTIDLGFEAQPRNPCSSSPRARCHPISRLPGYRVPDLCDHPWSSAPGLLLLPRFSSLHAMPHLPPAHHETSKRDSPNKTKGKEKQNEQSRIQIQTSPSQWLITIKPRNWPLGFSISPLMSPLTTKAQSLTFESKTPWSIARRPIKPRKAQKGHLEEGKPQKPTKGTKSGKAKQNGKKELTKAQKSKKSSKSTQKLKINTPPEINSPLTLSMQALPLR
jgi:hypothetical protein